MATGIPRPWSPSPPCVPPSPGAARRCFPEDGGSSLAWMVLPLASRRRRRLGGGGAAFAPSCHRLRRRPKRDGRSVNSVALKSLFPDDPMLPMHAAGVTTTPSLSSSRAITPPVDARMQHSFGRLMTDWNPLQGDVERWLAKSTAIHDTPVTGSSIGTATSIIASSSSSASSPRRRPDRAPTEEEVKLLQSAFGAFYGTEKNAPVAYELLSDCINVWETTHQGGDEIAGLYRVRGDVQMELLRPREAEADYATAIQYLEGPDGGRADPEELPAARLGRARAVRSLGSAATPSQALQASKDYEIYFNSMSEDNDEDAISPTKNRRRDGETAFSEAIVDGIQKNPYAAWEWGMVDRAARNYERAAKIHRLAETAFEEIGDKPRSVICALDRGLDLASGLDGSDDGSSPIGSNKEKIKQLAMAKETLEDAIRRDVDVGGRDVEVLQRLVAKEGEARIALAGVLWSSDQKGAAEAQYGTACSRLDELNADFRAREEARAKKGGALPLRPLGASLGYSIDNIVGAEEANCSRFKNDRFIKEKLVWNEGLQKMVKKFLMLSP